MTLKEVEVNLNVEDIFLRDEKREKDGNGRRADIVKYTIALDKFTLMNTTYVKQSFSDKKSVE